MTRAATISAALTGKADLYAALRGLAAQLPDLSLTEVLAAAPKHEAARLRGVDQGLLRAVIRRGQGLPAAAIEPALRQYLTQAKVSPLFLPAISEGPSLALQTRGEHPDMPAFSDRAFDAWFMGDKVYGTPLVIESRAAADMPEARENAMPLGRHLDGCRIGFDLGGSDRKCAAVIDGTVVFSEEIPWDPYFQSDPQYHYDGIMDSLQRAAAHLPRVDAIGGSAAGVYVNNEVRVASLFRGITDVSVFDSQVRDIFLDLARSYGVPFEVLNDGDVTALAGSMSLGRNAVLGVAMGTSVAAGYVDSAGNLTNWLSELAFVPVDYRLDGPADEWSGDRGCAVQYFSQQGVGRLLPLAGIPLPPSLRLPEQLEELQRLITSGLIYRQRTPSLRAA